MDLFFLVKLQIELVVNQKKFRKTINYDSSNKNYYKNTCEKDFIVNTQHIS